MCTQTECSIELTRKKGATGGFSTTKHIYPSYDRTVLIYHSMS